MGLKQEQIQKNAEKSRNYILHVIWFANNVISGINATIDTPV